jgi:hypothetical protein
MPTGLADGLEVGVLYRQLPDAPQEVFVTPVGSPASLVAN